MADDLKMTLAEVLRKAQGERDVDVLREGVHVLSTVAKVPESGRVVSQAVVLAIEVKATGEREVLGLDMGPQLVGSAAAGRSYPLFSHSAAHATGICADKRKPPGAFLPGG